MLSVPFGMSDIPGRIWPLSVRKINGIGPKETKKLISLGITTIAELAQTELSFLSNYFSGSYSHWLHDMSRGIDNRQVITHSEPKSISRETTFEQDLHPHHDRPALSEAFIALCTRVAEDLQCKGYVGRNIGIKLRFEGFYTATRDFTLTTHTADSVSIRRAAGECLSRVALEKKVRLLGVRVSTLVPSRTSHMTKVSLQRELPLLL